MTRPPAHILAAGVLRTGVGDWIARARRSEFAVNVARTFGTRVVLIAVGVVTSVLTTRELGPVGRGAFAVAAAVSALCVQFGNLGLHASNTYVVARRPETLPVLVANTMLVSLALGAAIGGALALVATLRPDVVALGGTLLPLVVVSVPAGIAYLLLQNLLIGVGRVRHYNGIEVAVKVGGVALIAALLALGVVTPRTIFGASVLTTVAGCALVAAALPRFPLSRLRPSATALRSSFTFGGKAFVSALLSYLTLRVDVIMVQHYLGDRGAGYYSLAATYGDLVYMLPVVVGTLLFPKLSALPSDADRRALLRRSVRALGPAMILAVTVAGVSAPWVVRLLYGVEFSPSVPAIVWLMPGLACLSVNTLFMNYFASIGMPAITVVAPAVAVAVNVAANLVLIPSLGIVGASVASSVAYAVMLGASVVYLARNRGGRP